MRGDRRPKTKDQRGFHLRIYLSKRIVVLFLNGVPFHSTFFFFFQTPSLLTAGLWRTYVRAGVGVRIGVRVGVRIRVRVRVRVRVRARVRVRVRGG